MKPKIAFLFLTYGDIYHPKLWERYLQGHEETTAIYCHAADRSELTTPFIRDNQIPYWVSTTWGGLGLVTAHIELLRNALCDPNVERFVLCSEACVPIKTYDKAYEALFETEKSWLEMYTYFIERMHKVTHIPREHWKKHAQWAMLNRKHANMLIRVNYTPDFCGCVVPDEHYVGTVLTHLGQEEEILHRDQTAIKWHRISAVQMTPIEYKTITDENIDWWRKSPAILTRKVMRDSDFADRWEEITGD